MTKTDFYVYQYSRPWGDKAPCYIGKGRGRRWRQHLALGADHTNKIFGRIFSKSVRLGLTMICEKLHEGLSEDEALAMEMALIAKIGRIDLKTGPLANLTPGGENCSHGPDARQRISASRTGKLASPETKKKLSESHKGLCWTPAQREKYSKTTTGRTVSPETGKAISAALMGHVLSPETRAKISAAHTGKKRSPAAIEKTRLAHIGMVRTPECRARIGAAHRGKIISEEARAKMRAAKLGKKLSPEHRAKLKGNSNGFKKGNRCGALRKSVNKK